MKKVVFILLSVVSIITLSSCRSVFRVYDDQDIESLAISEYGFTSVLFFKIVDPDTALELTGDTYNNSGVIYGIKDDMYHMIFIPKLASKDPFLIEYDPVYDVITIYELLNALEDNMGHKLFNDPSLDYGGLSISISPHDSISEKYPNLSFESPIFFIITTDDKIFYVSMANEAYVIFDQNLNRLK